jgi:uncharacterized protein YkvS
MQYPEVVFTCVENHILQQDKVTEIALVINIFTFKQALNSRMKKVPEGSIMHLRDFWLEV